MRSDQSSKVFYWQQLIQTRIQTIEHEVKLINLLVI